MHRSLTKEEEGLEAILKDPVKSAELADRAIDAWIEQESGKRSRRSSRRSKKGS